MLSKDEYRKGLKELEEVFDGFVLTEGKIKIWYKYSKNIEDHQWQNKIRNCIRNCRKIPTLADILDIKGWYRDDEYPYQKVADVDEYDVKVDPQETAEARRRIRKGLERIGIIPKGVI
jgi:hypothetical protein